jgi:hypothetical protein
MFRGFFYSFFLVLAFPAIVYCKYFKYELTRHKFFVIDLIHDLIRVMGFVWICWFGWMQEAIYSIYFIVFEAFRIVFSR